MNIKVPYKWLKEYVKLDLTPEEFGELMPLHGPQVETWEHNEDLDDIVFDIEVTPNRIDTASIIGMAREAAAITNSKLEIPKPNIEFPDEDTLPLDIAIEDKERCRRFHAIVIDGVSVGETPEWMKNKLEALGHKSINNLVDISNYVLLEYGYPTHVFDYEKIEGNKIIIRRAHEGEEFITLDGEEKELTKEDLVIADSEKAISLAGVKGGINSGVSTETKTIVIEAANFEPYAIRKTARRHELHTDAASLFEKGLSPYSPQVAIKRVAELILEIAGGEIISPLKDEKSEDYKTNIITFHLPLIKRMIGIEPDIAEVCRILESLEFKTKKIDAQTLEVTVPHFRTEDVSHDYDLVEEVARIIGYENVPSLLPDGQVPDVAPEPSLVWEDKVKDILAGIGLSESFSISIVGDEQLEYVGLDRKDVLSIHNPFNDELTVMRSELTSTMITIAKNNEDYVPKLTLFELNMVYIPQGKHDLPKEQTNLTIMINGINKQHVYLDVKGYFEHVLTSVGISLNEVAYERNRSIEYLDSGATADIIVRGTNMGTLGVLDKDNREEIGIKKETAILEVNFDLLLEEILKTTKSYQGIPKYPSVSRDFAFIMDSDTAWIDIKELVISQDDLIQSVELFDVYSGKGIDAGKKSIAFNVVLQSDDKTLEDEDVIPVVDAIIKAVEERFDATLRS